MTSLRVEGAKEPDYTSLTPVPLQHSPLEHRASVTSVLVKTADHTEHLVAPEAPVGFGEHFIEPRVPIAKAEMSTPLTTLMMEPAVLSVNKDQLSMSETHSDHVEHVLQAYTAVSEAPTALLEQLVELDEDEENHSSSNGARSKTVSLAPTKRADLLAAVHNRTGLSKKKVQAILTAMLQAISEEVMQGMGVNILALPLYV
jgi:hypothetical protein